MPRNKRYKGFLKQGSGIEMSNRTRRRRLEAEQLIQQRQSEVLYNNNCEGPILESGLNAADDATQDEAPHFAAEQNTAERAIDYEDEFEQHVSEASEPGFVQFSENESDFDFSETFSSAEDVENDNSLPFEHLISFLKSHANIRELKINHSVADIIFLILTFCLVHNLSLMAMCDLMKLFNVLCGIQIFPATQYFFKKYFNPSFGMQVHYTCSVCGHYLGNKNEDSYNKDSKSFLCKCCENENFIEGYKYDNAFVTVDIAKQIKELLENPSLKFSFNSSVDENVYSDFQSGCMYNRTVPDTDGLPIKYITFTFNSDSSPVSKDGKTKINPIYLMVNELDYNVRSKHLILAGVTYGKSIIRNDVFLKPFVEQLNVLARGININILGTLTKVKMLALCCCVDSIARAPMQGIKSVGGYYSCSWCHIKGEAIESTKSKKLIVKYPIKDSLFSPRTETSFRSSLQSFVDGESDVKILKGVNSVSPLMNLTKFSMVWSFVPDLMHLVLLGVTKRFLNIWFFDCNFEGYIGGPQKIKYFDTIIESFKIPSFVQKLPLSLTNHSAWKSKHFENWLLFYSIPLLKGNLPRKFFNHWKVLVEGVGILMQDHVSKDDVTHAENLLINFVSKTEEYYGKYEMTYNMHQLCHLAESVRRFGPLWSHTAYPFESGIGYLKSVLKASKGIPQQIIRSLELGRALIEIYKNCEVSENILNTCESLEEYRRTICVRTDLNECFLGIGKKYDGNFEGLPNGTELIQYPRAVKNGITFCIDSEKGDTKRDNSYVQLNSGLFAHIKKILCTKLEPKQSFILLENILFEDEPNMTYVKRVLAKGHIFVSSLSDIKCVAAHLYIDEYNEYLCTIPIKHYKMNM